MVKYLLDGIAMCDSVLFSKQLVVGDEKWTFYDNIGRPVKSIITNCDKGQFSSKGKITCILCDMWRVFIMSLFKRRKQIIKKQSCIQ